MKKIPKIMILIWCALWAAGSIYLFAWEGHIWNKSGLWWVVPTMMLTLASAISGFVGFITAAVEL